MQWMHTSLESMVRALRSEDYEAARRILEEHKVTYERDDVDNELMLAGMSIQAYYECLKKAAKLLAEHPPERLHKAEDRIRLNDEVVLLVEDARHELKEFERLVKELERESKVEE